jgi:hypothetical protein
MTAKNPCNGGASIFTLRHLHTHTQVTGKNPFIGVRGNNPLSQLHTHTHTHTHNASLALHPKSAQYQSNLIA